MDTRKRCECNCYWGVVRRYCQPKAKFEVGNRFLVGGSYKDAQTVSEVVLTEGGFFYRFDNTCQFRAEEDLSADNGYHLIIEQ